MPEKSKATIIDVAREAGVSFKTVSRVLNGESHVKEDTRAKVLNAARRLNYHVNQTARGLRTGASQIIILVANNPSRSYVESLHMGALQRAYSHEMRLILDEYAGGVAGIAKVLDDLNPIGLLLAPPMCDDAELVNMLDERGVRYVCIAPDNPYLAPASVNIDDMAAAREMTAYLISLGHTHIGLVCGHEDHAVSRKREQGYLSALQDADIAVDRRLIETGAFDWASGLAAAERLLDNAHRLTAIFASNDDMAAAAIAVAYRRGLNIPNDISIAGFDDTSIASIVSPQLTTVHQPIRELAAEAIAMLTEPLNDFEGEQRTVFLEHKLIVRESTWAVGSELD
jgi:LacI family transcriptional regulator